MSLDVLQGRPIIEDTPSGLKKITRFKKLSGEGAKSSNISSYFAAYGTADVEFTNAFLVDQRIDRRSEQGLDVSLVQVFQELADSALTATTEVRESTSFDGRRVLATTYLCKASQASSLRPAIGSGSPPVFDVVVEKNGPVGKLVVSTINLTDLGFILSQSDDEKNNGALLVRTIRTVGQAPATPSGYTLISPNTQKVDGYTVYNYTFVKGVGSATIVDQKNISNNGKLVIYKRVGIATAPSAPSATISGTVTLIEDNSRQEDGYVIYDRAWAEGKGVIRKDTQAREGGLRIETWVSLGASYDASFMLPGGILAAKDSDEIDGVTRWTVSCWQNSAGGDPTSGTALSYTDKWPFRYPGRIKVFTRGFSAVEPSPSTFAAFARNVFKSPPSEQLVDATVKVTYQTSASLGSLDNTLWNPTTWATLMAQWEGWNVAPKDLCEPVPNYRAVTDEVHTITVSAGGTGYSSNPTVVFTGGGGSGATAVAVRIGTAVAYINITNGGSGYTSAPTISFTGGGGSGATATAQIGGTLSFTAPTIGGGYTNTCFGERVYGGSSGSITISGGPAKPDGNTYVIDKPSLQPAFVALDGTQYYRKTQIIATIPTQDALPL